MSPCPWWCPTKCHPHPGNSSLSPHPQAHVFPLSNLASLYPLSSEPPVTMVRVPQDMGVTEMGVASFECELSRPSVEVKWFKVRVCLDPFQQHPAVFSLLQPLATAHCPPC